MNREMCNEWSKAFGYNPEIKIVNDDIISYAARLKGEAKRFLIVSPANSFGMMDGGYDLGITKFYFTLGIDIIKRVQNEIYYKYLGEQPIATTLYISLSDDFGFDIPSLIHIPTMRYPMDIRGTNVPYMCMKEFLLNLEFFENTQYDEVIIPAFGGGGGMIHPSQIAAQMKLAYDRCKEKVRIDLGDWNKISQEINHTNNMK